MALIGKMVNETIRYIPKSEKRAQARATSEKRDYLASGFDLRMLSGNELRSLKNLSTGIVERGVDVRVSAGSIIYETVRLALVGWVNFLNEHGDPIKFRGAKSGTQAHEKDMDCIQWDLLEELCDEVMRMNETTLSEKKPLNLAPSSPSTSENDSTASPAKLDTVTPPESSETPVPIPTSTPESPPDPETPTTP